MADAPYDRSTLYRKLRRIVTAASLALAFTQLSPGQDSRRGTVDKGPRALALIELAANGKAHLIPITIMYDGRLYDAGAYKAAPAPASTASTPTPAPAAPAATAPPEQEDPNRPVLKRGKPSAEAQPPAKSVASSTTPTASAKPANPAATSSSIQLIPAISDAGGP